MKCAFASKFAGKDLGSFGWCDCTAVGELCERHDYVSLWLCESDLFRDPEGNADALKKLCQATIEPLNGGRPKRIGCGECEECIGREALDRIRRMEEECRKIEDLCKPDICQELDAWQIENFEGITKEVIGDWEERWGLSWE